MCILILQILTSQDNSFITYFSKSQIMKAEGWFGRGILTYQITIRKSILIQYTHAIRSITDVTDKIYAKHSQYPILESTLVKLTSGRAHDGMPAADSAGLPLLGGLALHLHQSR